MSTQTDAFPALPASTGSETKPPLGPEPEHIWRENRMWHLMCRLSAFANRPDAQVQVVWLVELRDRINDVLQRIQSPNASALPRREKGENEPER